MSEFKEIIDKFNQKIIGKSWKLKYDSIFFRIQPEKYYNNGKLRNRDSIVVDGMIQRNKLLDNNQQLQIFKCIQFIYEIVESDTSKKEYNLNIFTNKEKKTLKIIAHSLSRKVNNKMGHYDNNRAIVFKITINKIEINMYIGTSNDYTYLHFIDVLPSIQLSRVETIKLLQQENIPIVISKKPSNYPSGISPLLKIVKNYFYFEGDTPTTEQLNNAKEESKIACDIKYNKFNSNCKKLDIRYCKPIRNIRQKKNALDNCQLSAKNKYREILKDKIRWVKDPNNIENENNFSNKIRVDKNNLENELITKCKSMHLGNFNDYQSHNTNNIISDENIKLVLNKYKLNANTSNIYPKTNPNAGDYNKEYAIFTDEDTINYKNVHPFLECKEDSYKLFKKICHDYSLADNEDAAQLVMPRKCNLQGLRSLLEECKKKNKEGQGDQFSNNDLRNMLPYNLTTLDEGEEKNGLCNNVKIDSYSVDKTFEIWQKIWNEHSEDLDEVARISNMTIKNEKEYLDETEAARDNYIHSINKFEEINSKKNCYLQGKDFVGIGNGSDGGDCGDQLPCICI